MAEMIFTYLYKVRYALMQWTICKNSDLVLNVKNTNSSIRRVLYSLTCKKSTMIELVSK